MLPKLQLVYWAEIVKFLVTPAAKVPNWKRPLTIFTGKTVAPSLTTKLVIPGVNVLSIANQALEAPDVDGLLNWMFQVANLSVASTVVWLAVKLTAGAAKVTAPKS